MIRGAGYSLRDNDNDREIAFYRFGELRNALNCLRLLNMNATNG